MSSEWISYKDSEVRNYHPICEEALNQALKNLKLQNEYEVIHHKVINKLEMDFVISNKNTKKLLCVIEVKRTPTDVHSSRYQYQALNYILNSLEICEKPYYILTNLEYAFCFRYDSDRDRPYNQMLNPGLIKIGSFKDNNQDEFMDKLIEFYTLYISKFIEDDYAYSISLKEFNDLMLNIKDNEPKWNSTLIYLLYEYIRGVFITIDRKDLKDIRRFNDDIESICSEAMNINFDGIFNQEEICQVTIKKQLLDELYKLGKSTMTGDDISESLHNIVSEGKEHYGEVPTDMELARILCTLSKEYLQDIDDIRVCDPAAGSGNLVSAAAKTFNIKPSNILCNDINPKLIQLLSLRLGLINPQIISPQNSPKITSQNIIELDDKYFKGVDLIVLNPPFVSGLYSINRKNEICNVIEEKTGKSSLTNIGQIGLEIPFLEYLNIVTDNSTVFSVILPLTYLTSKGAEGVNTRNFLLENFGLSCIFTFPKKGAFTEVAKSTCIMIGSKDFRDEKYVNIISAYDNIDDLNLTNLEKSMSMELSSEKFRDLEPGIEGRKVEKEVLREMIVSGWRNINSEMVESVNFVRDYIEMNDKLINIENTGLDIIRGNVGNRGASDLLFKSWDEANNNFYKPSIRNAKLNKFMLDRGDNGFLYYNEENLQGINIIINDYMKVADYDTGRQTKNKKTYEQLLDIVKKDSRRIFLENSILIPRGIRSIGRIYKLEDDMYVSTNFFVINNLSKEESIIIGTWMTTIFYQLNCEVQSKDQEGMRKLEKIDILNTYIPKSNTITKHYLHELEKEALNIEFLNLNNPEVRKVDKIWAEILFGDAKDEILKKSVNLLKYTVNKRNN